MDTGHWTLDDHNLFVIPHVLSAAKEAPRGRSEAPNAPTRKGAGWHQMSSRLKPRLGTQVLKHYVLSPEMTYIQAGISDQPSAIVRRSHPQGALA